MLREILGLDTLRLIFYALFKMKTTGGENCSYVLDPQQCSPRDIGHHQYDVVNSEIGERPMKPMKSI
jgi:hypothetical protein